MVVRPPNSLRQYELNQVLWVSSQPRAPRTEHPNRTNTVYLNNAALASSCRREDKKESFLPPLLLLFLFVAVLTGVRAVLFRFGFLQRFVAAKAALLPTLMVRSKVGTFTFSGFDVIMTTGCFAFFYFRFLIPSMMAFGAVQRFMR